MPVRFACSTCGARIRVPDGSGGKRTRCPRCGTALRIPEKSIDQPSPPPSAEAPAVPAPAPAPTAVSQHPPAISVAAPPVSDQTTPSPSPPPSPSPALLVVSAPQDLESPSSTPPTVDIQVTSSPPLPLATQPPASPTFQPPPPVTAATGLAAALPPTPASIGPAMPDYDRVPETPTPALIASPAIQATPLPTAPPPVPPPTQLASSSSPPFLTLPLPTTPIQKRLGAALAGCLSILGLLGLFWSIFASTYRLTTAQSLEHVLLAFATLIFGTGIGLFLAFVGMLGLFLLRADRSGPQVPQKP